MAQPERYFIGPAVRDKLTEVFTRVGGMAAGSGGKTPPMYLQDIQRPPQSVLVRNIQSEDIGAYHALGISGSSLQQGEHGEAPPTTQEPFFWVSVGAGSEMDIVITLEPIKNGSYGRAVISGVVAFRLERSSDTVGVRHKYATFKGAETKTLKSSGFGQVRILSSNPNGPDGWGWAIGAIGTYPYGHRLCKTAGTTFTKGTFQTLQVYENGTPPDETITTGETVIVWNKYASIPAGKFVSVAYHGNGRWYVVAAELS